MCLTDRLIVLDALNSCAMPDNLPWNGDVSVFLDALPEEPIFDLAYTLPPYNIGKA
jgi:hypothetical protein